MPTTQEIRDWPGQSLVGSGDDKLGTIDQVYLDRQTGEPTFASVKTGLFGSKSSLVPIGSARSSDGDVHVPFSKDQVKDAPNVDDDEELSEAEERRLYEHYGIDYAGYDGPDHDSMPSRDHAAAAGAGHDTSGPDTDSAMTRSEEELRVGTTQRETGRARLRKYVVTENVTTTVPVQREEVRIEREPITDANVDAATSGADITEEEHEVVLHAEEPVVEKNVVAKERVRMDTETVTDQVEVSDEVRKERIEAEGDTDRDRR